METLVTKNMVSRGEVKLGTLLKHVERVSVAVRDADGHKVTDIEGRTVYEVRDARILMEVVGVTPTLRLKLRGEDGDVYQWQDNARGYRPIGYKHSYHPGRLCLLDGPLELADIREEAKERARMDALATAEYEAAMQERVRRAEEAHRERVASALSCNKDWRERVVHVATVNGLDYRSLVVSTRGSGQMVMPFVTYQEETWNSHTKSWGAEWRASFSSCGQGPTVAPGSWSTYGPERGQTEDEAIEQAICRVWS